MAALLANCWAAYPDVEPHVLTLFSDDLFFSLDPKVQLHSLGLKPNVRGGRELRLARALYDFRTSIEALRPDFILSFMNKYNVFALAALLGSKWPVIVSERDSPTEPARQILWALRTLLYPTSRGIITQSEEGASALRARRIHPIVVAIPNPVHVSHAPQVRREKIVLNVARLVPKKGHDDLLRAFAIARQQDWRLVICGEGPLRPALQSLADSLSIGDAVEFAGTVKDVSSFYARASIFAFSSKFEGFPNALAEAMISGLAVASYDCPTGPAEMITHGKNGLLSKTGDYLELAHHLQELMRNDLLRIRLGNTASALRAALAPSEIARQYFDFCVARVPMTTADMV